MTTQASGPSGLSVTGASSPLRLRPPNDLTAPAQSFLEPRPVSPTDSVADGAAATMLSFLPDGPPEETKPLRFRTAREIGESTSDEVEFAAAYVAFGAITELDGKPKTAGKTTFVLELIRSLLDGRPFLAQPTVQGPVVMLTEQPPASLKPALVRAGVANRDDFVLLTWADAAGVPWPGIIGAAAAKCREIGARLLVVDTLPQFAGLRGDAENNSGDALEAIGPLQLLAADGFAILVTRHDRKSGGEVGESARGQPLDGPTGAVPCPSSRAASEEVERREPRANPGSSARRRRPCPASWCVSAHGRGDHRDRLRSSASSSHPLDHEASYRKGGRRLPRRASVAGIGHRVIRVRVSRRVTHRLLPGSPDEPRGR